VQFGNSDWKVGVGCNTEEAAGKVSGLKERKGDDVEIDRTKDNRRTWNYRAKDKVIKGNSARENRLGSKWSTIRCY